MMTHLEIGDFIIENHFDCLCFAKQHLLFKFNLFIILSKNSMLFIKYNKKMKIFKSIFKNKKEEAILTNKVEYTSIYDANS